MAAIARACMDGDIPACVSVVIAPNSEAPAVEVAQDLGLSTRIVDYEAPYGSRLVEALHGIDWVCLAGYLKLLPAEVLDAFPNRVLNIHPALLPKFGGKGMYGLNVHKAVIEAGETESGCTVHFVTPHYDEGAIILQLKCPVLPDDVPETLAARVLKLEHQAYSEALRHVLSQAV